MDCTLWLIGAGHYRCGSLESKNDPKAEQDPRSVRDVPGLKCPGCPWLRNRHRHRSRGRRHRLFRDSPPQLSAGTTRPPSGRSELRLLQHPRQLRQQLLQLLQGLAQVGPRRCPRALQPRRNCAKPLPPPPLKRPDRIQASSRFERGGSGVHRSGAVADSQAGRIESENRPPRRSEARAIPPVGRSHRGRGARPRHGSDARPGASPR